MSDTLIQTIEKALGREPPKSHSEQVASDRADAYLEALAARKEAAAQSSGQAVSDSNWFGSGLVSDIPGVSGSNVLLGLSFALAVVVVLLSTVTFRLSRRNKRMINSSYFENQVIGGMTKKRETLIWFRRQSAKGKEYNAFLKDLRTLVEKHQSEGGVNVRFTEGWRDE